MLEINSTSNYSTHYQTNFKGKTDYSKIYKEMESITLNKDERIVPKTVAKTGLIASAMASIASIFTPNKNTQIQKVNNKSAFKHPDNIVMSERFKDNTNPGDVSRIVNAIKSNKAFADIFSQRNGYIYVDREDWTYNKYAADSTHYVRNSLSVTFDDIKNKGVCSRLLSFVKPPKFHKVIDVVDYRCDFHGKDMGNITDRFCTEINAFVGN